MNKILLTTLTTAMLATSGFAGGQQEQQLNWEGDINVQSGASVISTQTREFTKTMGLEKGVIADQSNNIEEQSAASLRIAENETVGNVVVGEEIVMTLKGGTIQATAGEDSGDGDRPKPRIILNGKLLLDKVVSEGDSPVTTYPTLKDVVISSDNQGDSAKLLEMGSLRELPKDQNNNSKYGGSTPEDFDRDKTAVNVTNVVENNDVFAISGVSLEANKGIGVKLPFYCNFGKSGEGNNAVNLDLSNAAKVEYDYLHVEGINTETDPTNIKGSVGGTAIKDIPDPEDNTKKFLDGKVIDELDEYYGHYAKNADLGVSLPMRGEQGSQEVDLKDNQHPNGKVEATEVSGRTDFTLAIVATTIQNATELTGKYLNTNAFDDPTEAPKADSQVLGAALEENAVVTQEYKFGFAGTHPVSITLGERALEGSKAIFSGDNQYYVPADTKLVGENTVAKDGITLSTGEEQNKKYTPVEFAGNNSLFPFNQTYGKGTFAEGNYTNTLPAGKTAEFKEGFSLGAGHTLIVKGTLIG